MTLEELYFISQTVAAVAVIASLVYLALQTRQAARNTRAVMHENRAASVVHFIDTVTAPEFHPIWMKGNNADPDMSDADIDKYTSQVRSMVVVWEERFREKREGMLDERRWASSEATISASTKVPGFRAAVAFMGSRLDPEFKALLDKHVALGRASRTPNAVAAWRDAAAKERTAMEQTKTEEPRP